MLDEKELLSIQFTELAQKFHALLEQLEIELNDFLNTKDAEKNKINAVFLTFQTETRKSFERQIADLRTEHKKEIDNAREVWEQKKLATKKLEIEKAEIKHKRFFEEEIKKT